MDADDHFDSERDLLGTPSVESLANSHPRLAKEFRNFEPVWTAASFAALLTAPELQANCYRLEYLIHLAVAYCEGKAQPTQDFVQRSFKILGDGICGMAEDPAEDVFVSLVSSSRGNFRVFEGIHEGNGFYLQRILNVVETMPPEQPFQGIRDAVEALLKLSEAVAERAGLAAGDLGQELPLKAVLLAIESPPILSAPVRVGARISRIVQHAQRRPGGQRPENDRVTDAEPRRTEKPFFPKHFHHLACRADARERFEEVGNRFPDLC
ncbi:MAG: hypothetical protein LAP87_22560, partial [Acidobacteriia bacterium]|nr:hypothetical protein [Terriglobia bacterium]